MERRDLSEQLMKSVGIFTKISDGKFVIKVPANIWDKAEKEFSFSFDMLEVGGDLSLPELAKHLDEQSANEARFGSLAEMIRYQKGLIDLDFDIWYSSKFYIAKGKDKASDKSAHAYILKRWPKEYRKRKQAVIDMEFKYRLVNNAIFSSIMTKGKMLQSLRNVIQGNNFQSTSIGAEKQGRATIKG